MKYQCSNCKEMVDAVDYNRICLNCESSDKEMKK